MRAARTTPPVTTTVAEGVAWMTLARPASGNRLDLEVMQGLTDACTAIALDPAVHVVVLQAGGRHFSVGLPPRHGWLPSAWPDGVAAIAALGQPVLAAIDGEARGWGLALALACDVRVVSTRAIFSAPGFGTGRFPGGGITQRLPRMIGTGRAMALLALGQRLGARDAVACGLACEAVSPSRLARTVAARGRALAARGPVAVRYAKEAVVRALDLPLEEGMRLEHDLYVLLQTTADRREGLRAFLERRPPRFDAR
ncbi:MAG: enoyl-CoA hydratase/isomerase family protein [Candidatus Binatia bacterium]